MSARDRLYTAIEEPGTYDDPRDIHELIDAYAHELAEEIRQAWAAHDPKQPGNVTMLSALNAADLIDPESAGPVRPDEEFTP